MQLRNRNLASWIFDISQKQNYIYISVRNSKTDGTFERIPIQQCAKFYLYCVWFLSTQQLAQNQKYKLHKALKFARRQPGRGLPYLFTCIKYESHFPGVATPLYLTEMSYHSCNHICGGVPSSPTTICFCVGK